MRWWNAIRQAWLDKTLGFNSLKRSWQRPVPGGCGINFIKWETGSVLPESGKGMEHMASFDYGYKIAAVRDWLFLQSKQ